IVGVDEKRNILVLAGTSVDQAAWSGTITSFDVDWLANRSVGVFPIQGRSARSIVRGLELLVDTAEGAQPMALFEVIPENNSILAVARTPEALHSVARWVRRLTIEGQNDARVYSYDMRYARASDIAGVLGQILGIQVDVPGAAGVSSGVSGGSAVAAMAPAPGFGFETSFNAAMIEAQQVQALEAQAASIDGALAPSQRLGLEGTMNQTRIVASEPTNSLLIYATPPEYERILGVLDRLDVPQRQVLVEATIIEVTLNDSLRLGVQYFLESEGSDFVLSVDESLGLAPTLPGFTAIINTPANVVVDALDDLTEVNVISSPNMMVLNNQSARLSVGATVPVAIRQAQEGLEDTDVFASEIEFRDTGVIFDVTPRINSSGSVVLDIRQEVSSVLEADAETLTPTISQRLLQSAIAVDSGETVALGGLFSSDESRGRSGIPFLVDIPVAGVLFGSRRASSIRTELLVLITPRIVNNALDARRVTRSLRDRFTSVAISDAQLSTSIDTPSIETRNSRVIGQLFPELEGVLDETPPPAPPPAALPPAETTVDPQASLAPAVESDIETTAAPSPPPAPIRTAALPAPSESSPEPIALDLAPEGTEEGAAEEAVAEEVVAEGAEMVRSETTEPVASDLAEPVRAAGPGETYVVLGSFRDPEGPARRWGELETTRAEALSTLEPVFDSQNGLNRVSVGPFAAGEAEALCGQLDADCFVESRQN
ncbi:MAG: secretin N-terminal domain-containing protein, partial [Pseudomonadota bacterium]